MGVRQLELCSWSVKTLFPRLFEYIRIILLFIFIYKINIYNANTKKVAQGDLSYYHYSLKGSQNNQ